MQLDAPFAVRDWMDLPPLVPGEVYGQESKVPMGILALPERIDQGVEATLPDGVQEPKTSAYLHAINPPCQVLPAGSDYDAAYDFYTLDADPAEFVRQVPEPYRTVIRSGSSATVYDARQLVEAVKGDARNDDLSLDDRSYVLNTDRGTCALARQQYVDIWERANDRMRAAAADSRVVVSAIETVPLEEVVRSLSDPNIAERILSDGETRRLLVWRLADAYIHPQSMDEDDDDDGMLEEDRAMIQLIDAIDTGSDTATWDPKVARAELILAVALQDADALDDLSAIFPEGGAEFEAALVIRSLLDAPDRFPDDIDAYDAEEFAKKVTDAFPLGDLWDYQNMLEIAARAGAQSLAEHIVDDHLYGELDCKVAADLAVEARDNGHEELADYFDECPGRE